ncbi:unnamed protein product [Cylicocyclus nassatus]|uniref:Uncharacterized protein n=1 Tax=Cylicocyclus nassatus TaxID=53992 RepID=A0AA36GSE0_CYLNA|nr:unnamed protein product [Cylicocyclus nassatus]
MPEELSAFSTSILMQLGQNLVPATMLLLAIIAILASLGFAFVLIAFLRQKWTGRHVAVKSRYQPFSPATCGIAKEENRYDLPWEHTCPLTCWVSSSSKSEATTTSPLESTSSTGLWSSIVMPYAFRSGGQMRRKAASLQDAEELELGFIERTWNGQSGLPSLRKIDAFDTETNS